MWQEYPPEPKEELFRLQIFSQNSMLIMTKLFWTRCEESIFHCSDRLCCNIHFKAFESQQTLALDFVDMELQVMRVAPRDQALYQSQHVLIYSLDEI